MGEGGHQTNLRVHAVSIIFMIFHECGNAKECHESGNIFETSALVSVSMRQRHVHRV